MKDLINEELKGFLDQEPITTGRKANVNVLETYQECLAQAYAVDGWIVYMENLINALVRDTVMSFKSQEELRYKQGKIAGLKELLIRSKKAFELSHKIKKVNSLQRNDKGKDPEDHT